jgi:biopolymer transport protein ExbB
MNRFHKVLAVLAAALILTPVAAMAQEKSLDSLLREVRAGRQADAELNKKREAEFQSKKNQQQKLLADARAERKRQELRSERLEASFQQQERDLAQLEDQLTERLGSLGELFGVVRQVAGETRGIVENSMVSAQFPGREEGLEKLAGSRDLPSIGELEDLWYTLQQEITESGKAVTFQAKVTQPDGTKVDQTVSRIGVFTALSNGEFLDYNGESGSLRRILKQPLTEFTNAADDFTGASAGEFVEAPLDPSKGALLALLTQTPDTQETVEQGGGVGYIIIGIGILGSIMALIRLFVLFTTNARVNAQAKSDTADENNPLGRVMKIYQDNPESDVETLELKLDEAILREVSALETFLSTIKVFSAIAPLLGLLGTVVGMIETFQLITLFGTGDPKLMASGISKALVTTMLGLIVAIPLTLLHSLVQSRAKSIAEVIEERSAGIVARRAEAAS